MGKIQAEKMARAIIIAINHGRNISGNLRQVSDFNHWYKNNRPKYSRNTRK